MLQSFHILRVTFSITVLWVLFVPGIFANEDVDLFEFKGDFRYRYERIELINDGLNLRTRHRIRARFGVEAKPADNVRIVLQIASGTSDPRSSNQTMSGTFSSKNIVLNLAYAEYQPSALKQHVTFIAGKSVMQWFRPGGTQLLWDSDLRPEGISSHFNIGYGELDLKLLGGYYIFEERADDANSDLLAAQMVGTVHTFPSLSFITAGIGYFHFTEIQGRAPFFGDEFFGNSYFTYTTLPVNPIDPSEVTLKHLHDYREIELFMEAWFTLRERPILLMADYVVNTKPETDNTGWLVGVKMGDVSKSGTWSIQYNYRRLEADALFGAFTDSNFGGGVTNGRGHEMGLSFGAFASTKQSLSYLHNFVGIDDGDKY